MSYGGKPGYSSPMYKSKYIKMKRFFYLAVLTLITQLTQLHAQTPGSPGKDSGTAGRIPAPNSAGKSDQRGPWQLNGSLNPGITLREPRFVIGADLQLERYVSSDLALTLSAGYTHITNKTGTINYTFPDAAPVSIKYNTDRNMIPLKLGIKVFPAEKIYLHGAGGIAIDINGNSSFVWSATAGIKLGSRYDLGLKYENYTDFSWSNQLSVRLGYRIF